MLDNACSLPVNNAGRRVAKQILAVFAGQKCPSTRIVGQMFLKMAGKIILMVSFGQQKRIIGHK